MRLRRRACVSVGALTTIVIAGCGGDSASPTTTDTSSAPRDTVLTTFAGTSVDIDVAALVPLTVASGFITYTAMLTPANCGLTASAGRLSGMVATASTVVAVVTATDAAGKKVTRTITIVVQPAAAIQLSAANAPQSAVVGQAFSYDATRGGTAFSSASGAALSYEVTFAPAANGLSASNGRITGTPSSAAVITATVTARDATGNAKSDAFPIVLFSNDLTTPTLTAAFNYSDATAPLPQHFLNGPGGVLGADNTPATNPITNAGATLGRVLFYDRRLSVNDRVSCASCHQQRFGFGDTAVLSVGFNGGRTGRHSMALANARFYASGRFFWDERAATLEEQVLQPIQNNVEMGMTLPNVITKVATTSYYAPLFQAAFGSAEVTSDRIARALAQFVRSMVSGSAKVDRAFNGGPPPNFAGVLTADEFAGQQLFTGAAGCARCHGSNAFISDAVHNTGLDATITDVGAGGGRFKAPSLRNIATRKAFMHDGRFATLEQVVDFYNNGIQPNPNLDPRLRGPGGQPQRLNLSTLEKSQLVAFLRTLTDSTFLANPKFATPY